MVLAFQPHRILFCITHYAQSSNAIAVGVHTSEDAEELGGQSQKKKARRKDVAHCMGELEEIVAMFEEINKMKETNPQLPWVFAH
jgi:hypothetical protein